MLMEALCIPSLGVYCHVTGILHAENGQKVENLNRLISISTDIEEKKFVIFEQTINHLSCGYAFLFMFI